MQYLESNDLAKLFRTLHATNQRHHLVALCGFFTGARISQILRLRGEDIFEANGKTVIKIHAAKRGLVQHHNLHFDARPEFDMSPLIELAHRRPMALIFAGLSRQYYNLILKKACADAGIHTDFGHSHVLRHSCAQYIFRTTQRIGAVSAFLGHRSPSSAFSYLTENDNQYGQQAMDALSFESIPAATSEGEGARQPNAIDFV